MKEMRYLIRIAPKEAYMPADQANLLARVRTVVQPHQSKAINLRVTPNAIEFDLFCAPGTDLPPILASLENLGKVMTCKQLGIPPGAVDAQRIISEARQLFNEHRFWEVHEVLEDLWKACEGQEKQLVQGLILCAAALVHAQKNETGVVWSLLTDALARLKDQPPSYYGWDIDKFRTHFNRVLAEQNLDFPTV
jgi:hypothetical protein